MKKCFLLILSRCKRPDRVSLTEKIYMNDEKDMFDDGKEF